MTKRPASPTDILTVLSLVKRQLDSVCVGPTPKMTKGKREAMDKHNLLVLSFVGKWLERRLLRFENEDRVPNREASQIIHVVMDHVVIQDHSLGYKVDCEEEHDCGI